MAIKQGESVASGALVGAATSNLEGKINAALSKAKPPHQVIAGDYQERAAPLLATPPQDNEDNGIEVEETKVDEKSPYAHLIMRLYKKYGCSPSYFPPRTDFASDMEEELYAFAEALLDNWDECDKVRQKDCLQKTIFDGLIEKLGNGERQSLQRLRRHCSRRCVDLEDEEDGGWSSDISEAKREELKIMCVMEFLCTEIESLQNIPKTSEHEDVFVWRELARILHGQDIVVRVGELGSSSTREDRKELEEQYGGKESNVRSRKIDILHQLTLRGSQPIELISWEAKPETASSETLQIQQRKNIRINAILDIVGPRALIYSVRLLEPRIFGAGAIAAELIELPKFADEIGDFLTNGNLSALLRVAEQNTAFARLIRKGFQKVHNSQIRAKMTGKNIILDSDTHPVLFTPSRKRETNLERPLMTVKKPRMLRLQEID
ncbi:hypothetical protein BGX27_003032 [Mortierella sp. AM989]|nr:hypothetical protein BGX27_003032 [Mortierella sp. AM989]